MNEKKEILQNEESVENRESIPSMDDFSKELDQSFTKISKGDILGGTIIGISADELLVNIGYVSDAIIPAGETMSSSEQSLQDLYKVGDQVNAQVVKTDDGEGNVLLSIKKAESILVWDDLEEAYESGKKITVKVNEVVKGGVTCRIKGIRAFIPASLLSVNYVEDLSSFVNQEFDVKVVDFDKQKRNIVLSRKEVEKEELEAKKEKLFKTIKKGDRYTGKVTKLLKFGAFVDLGGVEGLIHNNDLSWSRVKHPSEIVKEGDTVEVYVIDVDQEKERIALGLKDVNEDPWKKVEESFSVGAITSGEVVRLVDFGAFVKITQGVEGLVHISEISEKRVENPEDVLKVGDTVQVKVQSIDPKKRKISLSIKEAKVDENKAEMEKYKTGEEATTNLKDVFQVFLKDIER